MIPMCRPLLPPAEDILPYLKRIDETRWYTNAGPLVREYEERIGAMFGCEAVATSSGTSGLIAAVLAYDFSETVLTCPSWTFVATANAINLAGKGIKFIDVDEKTWTSYSQVATSPFGAPVCFQPSITDAAASFDLYSRAGIGKKPVVISTHATKCFSTGEGGLVLSRDKDFIQEVRERINHGITLERDIPNPGLNGKMSEYHAAVGLAELDGWPEKRVKWFDVKRRYLEAFGDLAKDTPITSLDWVGPTFCIRVEEGDRVRRALQENDIMSRKVWGNGVHNYEAYRNCPLRGDMFNTNILASEVVFLPFSIDMSEGDLALMEATLRRVM